MPSAKGSATKRRALVDPSPDQPTSAGSRAKTRSGAKRADSSIA
jgi:hypothetical protein